MRSRSRAASSKRRSRASRRSFARSGGSAASRSSPVEVAERSRRELRPALARRSGRTGRASRRRPSDRRGAPDTSAIRPHRSRVRGRSELADEPELLERRLELGAELAPLDPRDRAERRLDGRALPVAREVRPQPRAQAPRLPDVEHDAVAVVEEVDAGRRRRARDERAARVQLPRAGRGELDHLREGPRAALLREPEERDEDLGRRDRIRERAVARLARRPEEVRELPQREPLAATLEEPACEPHGVDDGRRHPPAGEALDGAVEEADVEARVVGGERRVAREREEAADRELGSRRRAELGVAQAR